MKIYERQKTFRNAAYLLACLACSVVISFAGNPTSNSRVRTKPAFTTTTKAASIAIPSPPEPVTSVSIKQNEPQFVAAQSSVQSVYGSVTLAWVKAQDPTIVSNAVYYGYTSGSMTNRLVTGDVTVLKIDGLPRFIDLFFSVRSMNQAGIESETSNILALQIPNKITIRNDRCVIETFGAVGKTNRIMMSTDMVNWQTAKVFVGNGQPVYLLHTNTQGNAFFKTTTD
jgi:hypothetical protein